MAIPEPPDTPREVILVELPGDQLEAIEENGGASLARWATAASTHRQAAAAMAAVYDLDFEEVRLLSLVVIGRYVRVSLTGDDAPKARRGRSAR